LWLKDPSTDKNRYLGVVFDPSPTFDKKSNMLNLWDGFATKPKKGNCLLTLTYIKDITSSQDEIMNTWILNFLAHMVQKSWEKPEVALLLKGAKKVGKTFFLDLVKALIDGKKRHLHCFKTSDSESVYGTYRAQLLNLIGLLLEEVTWGGDRKNESSLKDITSGKTITINIKWAPLLLYPI
jgi:putative DNA primase/helicase